MTRLITFATLGIVVALLALGAPAGALAQGPAGNSQWSRTRQGGPDQSLVGTAAAQLGVSRPELLAQLRSGTTLAEALKAGGVSVASFVDSFIASRAERLNAAVAAGVLTRAQADARLAALRTNVTARLDQPFTVLGPAARGARAGQGGAGQGAGQNFVDANGDGICDTMPAGGGQARVGAGHGPRR
ncbi:MAG: hypothetical protein SNJ69_02485 [Chloroflexaceae bacterium]